MNIIPPVDIHHFNVHCMYSCVSVFCYGFNININSDAVICEYVFLSIFFFQFSIGTQIQKCITLDKGSCMQRFKGIPYTENKRVWRIKSSGNTLMYVNVIGKAYINSTGSGL